MMKNFRTYNLSAEFYKKSRNLNLKGAMKGQFDRASLSIPLNLAEGWGKQTRKDRIKYFQIAFGSTRECQSLLQLQELTESDAYKALDKVAGSIYLLIKRAKWARFSSSTENCLLNW